MFILNVKVLCFDTLLQVSILKVVSRADAVPFGGRSLSSISVASVVKTEDDTAVQDAEATLEVNGLEAAA